ncbi:unnamed protein product [Vitrella brassicaformis CCMP3155]|uniref:Uncharacterized protein n=1 Tax=Vitrella brassicaformis (strain CCMP3155) TaxID=1169540 RepID=A0A0G4H1Y2_VITBC|nr:unnamed protein product [Vitrella brassicaformis CCMP3155]|eukprot:CEM37412.1 unnamed protein product [Vitrella brassicaformis CCMP3155]
MSSSSSGPPPGDAANEGGTPKQPPVSDCPASGERGDHLDVSMEQCDVVKERLREIKDELIAKEQAMGGTGDLTEPSAECMREILEFSLSGEFFRARRSTLCAAKGSVMALLFSGRFDQAFLRDQHGRIFLQIYPPVFKWLDGQLGLYVAEQTDKVALPPSRENDAPYWYWARLLLWDPATNWYPGPIGPPPPTQTQGHPHPPPPAPQLSHQQRDPEALSVELTSMIRRAKADKALQEARLDAIKPLLKTGDAKDDTLMAIEVSGATVTVTKGVAMSMGDDLSWANGFFKYDPSNVGVPVDYVQRIVDLVARTRMVGSSAAAACLFIAATSS